MLLLKEVLIITKRFFPLIWALILLITVAASGCQLLPSQADPVDPGVVPPGNDSDPLDPGPNDPSSPELTTIAPVPQEYAKQDLMAVIRGGDLWLLAEDGQAWQQTEGGNVEDVVWSPDGHHLVYTVSGEDEEKDLYSLAPGDSSLLLVDEKIRLIEDWPNTPGKLWSSDGSCLAYAKDGGQKLCITSYDLAAESDTYTLANEIWQGPFWISDDLLVYTFRKNAIPSVILVNSRGEEMAEWSQLTSPYPCPGGALVATGPFSSDGPSDTDYSGLARISLEEAEPIYDQPVRFSYLEVYPDDKVSIAIANGEHLVLREELPDAVCETVLLSQDILITYSNFQHPLWFAWAPDGNSIVALQFTITKDEAQGEGQEGYWDLVQVDRDGNMSVLLEKIYTVVDDNETNNPLRYSAPMCWSPSGEYIYYVVDRGSETYDLWRAKTADGNTELVLENCDLPVFPPNK